MKNTEEAIKTLYRKGNMYFAVYEKVSPRINSIEELVTKLNQI